MVVLGASKSESAVGRSLMSALLSVLLLVSCADASPAELELEFEPDTTTTLPVDSTPVSPDTTTIPTNPDSLAPPTDPDTTPVVPVDTAAGVIFVRETFDSAGFSQRGWYDNLNFTTSSVETSSAQSARSLEWRWSQGSELPSFGSASRRQFTPSESVYVSFWQKMSDNWVGSGDDYHPHIITLTTNLNSEWVGPASTRLTAYIEHVWRPSGGFAQAVFQDSENINNSYINQNAVSITENRAAHGCNGIGDPYSQRVSCYSIGGGNYRNGRELRPSTATWNNTPSSDSYKAKWHLVEAFIKMNTIQGGIGRADGIVRFWVDGALVIDVDDIIIRTGQHPTMKFNQFLLTPYIGSGSPIAQTIWIDDLIVANKRIPR